MPSSAPYLNFDLLITRAGDRYRALVVDAPGGDADIFFDLPPLLPDFQALLKFAGPRRGVREEPVESAPVASLDDVGSLLYEAIFQGDVHDVLVDSLALAADNAAGLRLRLRFHEDAADLATLPWEILYDARQERFLALSENLPILRYLSLPRPRPALVTEPPLRVLAVLASPVGLEELDLEGEWQVLVDALAPLVTEGKVVLDRLASPTLAVLQQRLLGDPVHVLHFVGHGIFDEESRQGMLVLADERDQPRLIGAREVAALLANHTSLRLLYLNACEGALGDDANVFAGLAQRLVQQGAPAAIAMQAEISDSASIELARTFYTALATGRPVDAALTQARLTLFMNSSSEWATPVLFSRAPDNRLFDIRAVLPTPDCPYPGMKPFNEAQKEFFFGRDKEIDDAVNRLAKHPFLAVIGPSGSGKSSLIYAGILPALRASRRFGPGPWTVHTLRPSDVRTPDGKAAPFQALSQLGDLSAQSPVLLFIDQFEEAFTLVDTVEARSFLDALHGLIGQPNLRILLTVRADFYSEMMAMGDLWDDVQANRLELKPLGEDELWAAIVEPAAHVGVEVEDALATALIADARGEAGVLPLVQETLVLLWEKVEGRKLKRNAYRQMAEGGRSGIQVAIDRHADVVYNTLPAEDRSIARRIFLRLIQFGAGRADTRRQQTVAELRAGGDDPVRFDETLRALVDGRLLTTGGEEGDPNRRVDISHEALIGGWALLQGWISEMRVAESTRRRLEDKVTEWLRLDKSGGLLDEYEVLEVEAWLAGDYSSELRYRQELIDLKDASRAALADAEAEKAEAERNRQRLRIFAGILALAALAIVLVGYFYWQAVLANTQVERLTRSISADRLTANALQVADEDPSLALLLAVEGLQAQHAYGETVEPSAQTNIHDLLSEIGGLPLLAQSAGIEDLDFSHDGRWLAAGSQDGSVRLWDTSAAKSAQEPKVLLGHQRDVSAVAFSSDGHWLSTGSYDKTVRLWDLTAPDPRAGSVVLSGHQAIVIDVAFSPDSRWLASAAQDSTVRLWDIGSDGTRVAPFVLDVSDVRSVRFSRNGDQLVGFPWEGLPTVWDLTISAPRLISMGYIQREGQITAVDLSPDGEWLATGGEGGLLLWNLTPLTSDVEPPVLLDQDSFVGNVAFSPNGRWLATESEDNVLLWNLTLDDPSAEPISLSGSYAEFSANNHWLATELGNNVLLWDLTLDDPSAEAIVLKGHADSVDNVVFSPNEVWLSTGSSDGSVRLWNLKDPLLLADPLVLPGDKSVDTPVALSSNGRWILTSSDGEKVRLWDSSSTTSVDSIRLELKDYGPGISTAVVSPSGRWLTAGFKDGKILLWDLTSPESPLTPIQPNRHQEAFLEPQIGVRDIAFSSDEHWMVFASDLGIPWLWDLTAAEPSAELTRLGVDEAFVMGVAFSPDKRWLAASTVFGQILLWDMADRKPEARPDYQLGGFLASAYALTFSQDAKWLAAGSEAGEVLVWDLTTLEPDVAPGTPDEADPEEVFDYLSAKPHAQILTDRVVRSIAFSPDGRWLVTNSLLSDSIQLWDFTKADLDAEPIQFNTEGVVDNLVYEHVRSALAFSPDGRWLIVGANETALLWTWRVDELIELACNYAGRNFSAREWRRYFPDTPYQRTCSKWPTHVTVVKPMFDAAWELTDKGAISEASEKVQEILEAEPGPDVSAGALNMLCLYGSTSGQASVVIDACEQAVELSDGLPYYRRSRGIALAMMNKFELAVKDFEVSEGSGGSLPYVITHEGREIRDWIESLQNGDSPFDSDELLDLINSEYQRYFVYYWKVPEWVAR
jgi:WD40 repeat protein/CHAT domain-containing protein